MSSLYSTLHAQIEFYPADSVYSHILLFGEHDMVNGGE